VGRTPTGEVVELCAHVIRRLEVQMIPMPEAKYAAMSQEAGSLLIGSMEFAVQEDVAPVPLALQSLAAQRVAPPPPASESVESPQAAGRGGVGEPADAELRSPLAASPAATLRDVLDLPAPEVRPLTRH